MSEGDATDEKSLTKKIEGAVMGKKNLTTRIEVAVARVCSVVMGKKSLTEKIEGAVSGKQTMGEGVMRKRGRKKVGERGAYIPRQPEVAPRLT